MTEYTATGYEQIKEIANLYSFNSENSVLYRGSSNSMIPSIVEKFSINSSSDLTIKEQMLINDFNKLVKFKYEFNEEVAKDWEIRIAAREHGLASSLMDWSNSLDIALEFSIFDFDSKGINYTSLWILNTEKIYKINISDSIIKKDSFQNICTPSIINISKYSEATYFRRKFIQGGCFLYQSPEESIISLEKNITFENRLINIILPRSIIPDVRKKINSKIDLATNICNNFRNSDKNLDDLCKKINEKHK